MTDKKPGRGADQFPLRFPEGMREEIKRLADEDGQSMNTKIIELLKFSIENSGVDLDEITKMLVDQRREISRLRKFVDQDESIATYILSEVLKYIDDIPPALTVWADHMLQTLEPDTHIEDGASEIVRYSGLPEHADEVRSRVEIAKKRANKRMDAYFEMLAKKTEAAATHNKSDSSKKRG